MTILQIIMAIILLIPTLISATYLLRNILKPYPIVHTYIGLNIALICNVLCSNKSCNNVPALRVMPQHQPYVLNCLQLLQIMLCIIVQAI